MTGAHVSRPLVGMDVTFANGVATLTLVCSCGQVTPFDVTAVFRPVAAGVAIAEVSVTCPGCHTCHWLEPVGRLP